MKNSVFTSAMKKAGLTTLMALTFGFAAHAQGAEKVALNKLAVKNIVANISNASDGVRIGVIDLAGKCKVTEAVDALVAQFKNETVQKIKLQIAEALYRIGDENGIKAAYQSALLDQDEEVKKVCADYYNEFQKNKLVAEAKGF